jgi:hypothetical protein
MDYNPQPISLIAEKKYLAGLQPALVLHYICVWWYYMQIKPIYELYGTRYN